MDADRIKNLILTHLEGTDKFLVEIFIKPVNRVFIFMDGDHGVTIKDCAALSRFLESQFDRETQDFELNVSSAGADQPIRLPRQYLKNIGRSLQIKLDEGQELKGKLVGADDRGITLEIPADRKTKAPKSDRYVNFENIIEAKVIISFK